MHTFKVYGTPPARAKALLQLMILDATYRARAGNAPHAAVVTQDFVDGINPTLTTAVVPQTLDFTPVTGGDVAGAAVKATAYIAALNAHIADGDYAHPGGADAVTTPVAYTTVTTGTLQAAVGAAKVALAAHVQTTLPHHRLPIPNTLPAVVISDNATAITSLNEQLALYERHINGAALLPEDVGT